MTRRSTRSPIAGLVLATLLLAGCEQEPAATAEEPSIFERGADQVMLGVEHYLTRDGLRRGVLYADTAFTYQEASRIELAVLEIRFYGEDGSDRGRLTGASGEYELASGDFTVRGDVVLEGRLESPDPSRLETDSLVYRADADELATEAPWTLTHPDGTVERGTSLVTDPGLRNIRRTGWQVTTPDVEVPQ